MTAVDYDLVLANARVVTPGGVLDRGWVGTRAGRLVAIERGPVPEGVASRELRDLDGAWLGPGFIDVHVHGSFGIDVMYTDSEGLRSLSRYLAGRGVTSYLAGTYTAAFDRVMGSLRFIAEHTAEPSQPAHEAQSPDGAEILGVYMEGPYLSAARKGAHPGELLRPIDRDEVVRALDLGIIRAMVFAPELADSDWLIDELRSRGVSAVVGHTDAVYEQVLRAFDAGAVSVTHTFSGMRGLHHREPGTAGAALLIDGLVNEVIADGVHVSPELLPLFWRMKGPEGIALITDAGPAGGMPDGHYVIGERGVSVSGGVGRLEDGTISSSAKTFDHNFALFCRMTGASFDEAWPSASLVPARIAGVADRKGSLEIGKDADLTALDDDGTVRGVVVGGHPLPDEALMPA